MDRFEMNCIVSNCNNILDIINHSDDELDCGWNMIKNSITKAKILTETKINEKKELFMMEAMLNKMEVEK